MLTTLDLTLAMRLERDRAHGACDYVAFGGLPLPLHHPELAAAGATVRKSPRVTRVAGLGLAGPVDPRLLAAALTRLERASVRLEVTVCPFAHPSLEAALTGLGYAAVEQENVLAGSPEGFEREPTPGLTVECVQPDRAEVWAAALRAGQELPPATARELLEVDVPLLRTAGVEGWVACAGDQLAGAGGLWLHRGLATLFAAGVAPAWRGRGVHRALLLARLARARALGAELVCMATEPGSASERNLERAGFAVQYTATVFARD